MSSSLHKSIGYRELPNSLSSNITSTTSNDIINFDFMCKVDIKWLSLYCTNEMN